MNEKVNMEIEKSAKKRPWKRGDAVRAAGMGQMNLRVPEVLLTAARARATGEGRSLTAAIREFLEWYAAGVPGDGGDGDAVGGEDALSASDTLVAAAENPRVAAVLRGMYKGSPGTVRALESREYRERVLRTLNEFARRDGVQERERLEQVQRVLASPWCRELLNDVLNRLAARGV